MRAKEPFSDEDEKVTADEIADVADETPTDVTPPELDPRTKDLTEWNDAPADHGSAVPKVGPVAEEEDEDSIAAKLVYEGTDEADRELRLAAVDPDYEP